MIEPVLWTTTQKTVVGQQSSSSKQKQNEKREFRFNYKVTVLFHLKLKIFPWLCVKVVKTWKIYILLTRLQSQFIELHNTQFLKILENLTRDCIILSFFLYSILKAFIYMKEECGLKEHTDNLYIYIYIYIYIYSLHVLYVYYTYTYIIIW